jgi:hypothetical protein
MKRLVGYALLLAVGGGATFLARKRLRHLRDMVA